MKSTSALLALAASTSASPLVSKRDDVLGSKETLCKGWDLRTPEGADDLWEKTAAGVSLELFIKSHWEHENSWVKNMEDQVQGGTSGKSGAAGCSALGKDCNPMGGPKLFSWIFQAVKGMHEKFRELNRQFTQETLINGLRIPQMVQNFDGSEDNPSQVRGWIAAAATIGNAVGGLVPGAGSGISAGFGILAGIFSALSLNGDEVDQGTISSALANTFEAATTSLEDTLRIATGGGRSEEEYNSLPAPKWDTYETKIAKFFNGGWFLVDDDEEAGRVTIESITNNIQKKVANDVMKAAKYHLVADKRDNVRTREDCGFAPGRQWLELKDGEEYFFYIMKNNPNRNRENEWVEAAADIYDKMASYGLGDREPFYRAIIDCGLHGGDNKEIDLSNLAWGQVPTCYFNLPAVFIEKDNEVGCASPFDNAKYDYLKLTPIS
ncbi:hypothetical protein NCS57_00203400 [Fusarium keratoplasticum]|uniref:Uncharacterized protein n=1 Tax=Fusarium keratoplasticum TaxID=1328300 RepID=A0ACC0R925_9HYPO|nr:hypothetical protein NCS57_00203400 [Fusarium keratoplasticum]KAI8679260.1 hypothetical protein NCS57_00203400 [Fusarium keratoplasticum]